jgi:AraC-like DNA-binding protein
VGNAEKRADIWLLLSSISRTEDEDPQTALELAQQAMEVYDSCGIPDKFVKAMLFATLALNDLERFEECFDCLEKSRELIIARQTDTLESAFFEYVQGETHFSQGMYKQAIQHFTTSLQLLTPFAAAERDLLVKVWQRILACYAASGNVSAYDETVDAYTAFFNGLNQERAEYTRKELVVLYGTREKSEELKKLNTKIAGLNQSIIDAIRLSRRKSWLIGMLVVAILTLTGLLTLSNVNTTNKSLKIQLFTMKRSLLKHDIPVFPSMGKEQETVNQKSGVENLNSEDSQFLKELFDRICQVMEKEMLYLKPDLNIDALSERVGYGSVQVSNAINSIGHMNFSAFVNQYRVKKSKRLIEHVKESESLSFSDVASMSGFQSYRTFYRVFKKHTEQTPREYRNAYWNK